jgi:4-diphosphocytidyl-2-C-methyl-D-erythritol kinase
LVNPQVQAPTPKVFAALDLVSEPEMDPSVQRAPAMGFGSDAVLDFRAFGHNDLEAAAISVAPQIETVLKRLSKVANAKAFGMSGSGATCFALFSDRRTAAATRRSLAADHPEWWIKATKLR